MRLLPSRRLLLLLALAALLFLVGEAWALSADLLLIAAAVADGAGIARRDEIRVGRRSPSRLALGGEGDVVITLANRSRRFLRLRVTDDLSPELVRSGDEVREVSLAPGEEARLRYAVRAEERGTAVLGDVHLRVLGPLGLVWGQWRVERGDRVRVQPGLRELRRYRLLARRHHLRAAGMRTAPQRGEGSSFESLREYIRGDDPRRIDWKASGKRDTLIVRQMQAERSQSVLLAIDTGRLMTERLSREGEEGDRERLDWALSAALLLAEVAHQHGDQVGLCTFAREVDLFLPPARGSVGRLADALAEVRGAVVEPDYPGAFSYLSRHLRRRSLLVVFTDVIDPRASGPLLAHLSAASRRHLPLAVAVRNPALEMAATAPADSEAEVFRRAAAEELLQARAHALAAMRRSGVLVADAHPRDVVPSVVNRYLQVKREALL